MDALWCLEARNLFDTTCQIAARRLLSYAMVVIESL